MQTLEGVRVLELGQYISGPYCGLILADQGADVIKIERPGVGDPRRSYEPRVERDGEAVSGGFLSYNRNKRSLALDLERAEGREILRRLVARVDVVVENLRPGAMESLGLGYESLNAVNPELIYCAISGFGRLEGYRGPFAGRPAFDTGIQSVSGLVSLLGSDERAPALCPMGFADIYSGLCAALAISLALVARSRTGHGTFIDQAMYDAVVSLIERPLMIHAFTGTVPARGHDAYAPVGTLRAADGYVGIVLPTDEMWRRFCAAIERPDLMGDPRLATVMDRAALFDSVIRTAGEQWCSHRTRREVVEHLSEYGVPAGEVQDVAEVFSSEQVRARKMLLDVDGDVAGVVPLARTPLLFSEFDLPDGAPAPRLGEHTRAVLSGLLDASDDEIDMLGAKGVVAEHTAPQRIRVEGREGG